MAEAFTLAEKEEIPRLKIAELLSETLFSSPVYKGYGDLVARHQYKPAGFRLRLGWKDVRLVLQVAQESETPMPDRIIARQPVPRGPGKKSRRPGLVRFGVGRFGRRGPHALTIVAVFGNSEGACAGSGSPCFG